jgi:hypothetical protein
MGTIFTAADAWLGGFYEVSLELERQNDQRLASTLAAIWSHPRLEGCYLDQTCEPFEQARVPFTASLVDREHLYGVAQLAHERFVAAGTCVIREDGGSDWVDLYLPMGSLGQIFPVHGFPFDDLDHKTWRTEVENWLAELASDIYGKAPFDLALVGFETCGEHRAAEIRKNGLPSKTSACLLLPENGQLAHVARHRQ